MTRAKNIGEAASQVRKQPHSSTGPATESLPGKNPNVAGSASQDGTHPDVVSRVASSFNPWRRIPDFGVLGLWIAVVAFTIRHHEPFADEAQAWLLSRDLGYRYLVFHQIAYEGHPPLWFTILWIANHAFHLPYQSLNWIGGVCAFVGCWFFVRYSPFPFWIRALFPFSYFMAYQYAVIARPYVLLPLFAFAAAYSFDDVEGKPWRFLAATSASALLCASGAMIAIGLVTARAWYILRSWKDIPPQSKRKLICALAVFVLVLMFLARVNWPPADRSFGRLDRSIKEGNFGFSALPQTVSSALLGSFYPSVALLLVIGAWCACRRRLLPFLVNIP